MAAPPSAYKDRHLLAVIGDEVRVHHRNLIHQVNRLQDSVTGLLLAGIGVRRSRSSDRIVFLRNRLQLIRYNSMSPSRLMPRRTS